MVQELTFDNLVTLIIEHQVISENKNIDANTLLEEDLGITGDDGVELLQEIEKVFDLLFTDKNDSLREVFELEENQYLFHSEGFSLINWIFLIFGKDLENVKKLSVIQLYNAAVAAKQRGKNHN